MRWCGADTTGATDMAEAEAATTRVTDVGTVFTHFNYSFHEYHVKIRKQFMTFSSVKHLIIIK